MLDLKGFTTVFAARILFILELGDVIKDYGEDGNECINIQLGDSIIVLKKESGNNHWIITAFEKEYVENPVNENNDYKNRNPEISFDNGASIRLKEAENSQNDSVASGSVKHKGSTPFAGGGVSDSARANADLMVNIFILPISRFNVQNFYWKLSPLRPTPANIA